MAALPLAVPQGVSQGIEEFTTEDLYNIVRYADLPDRDSIDAEHKQLANSEELLNAIKMPDSDVTHYDSVYRGGLYNKGAMNVFFHRKARAPEITSIDRNHLCHIAGSVKRLFKEPKDETYDALVGIEYGEETNPIDGTVTTHRHYEQVSFDDIIERRLSNLTGRVENLRCTGVIEARTDVKFTRSQSKRPPGFCIPIVFGVFAFSTSGRDEGWEPLGDRVTRMLHQCSEARSLTAARNILSMLNKPKLINEFDAAPKEFPRIQRKQELTKQVDQIKSAVRRQVDEVSDLAAVCSLLETAIGMVSNDMMEQYCQDHFRVRGLNYAVAEQFVTLAHKEMDNHGQKILQTCRSSLQKVLPFRVAEIFVKCVDGMFADGRWRYLSSRSLEDGKVGLSIHLVAHDDSETIELVKFKRTSMRALLSNMGIVAFVRGNECDLNTLDPAVSLSSLDIKWGSRLSPGQSNLYEHARKMCFKTTTPPFPQEPSVAPDFAKGALVFVSAAFSADVSKLVAECEQRGHRIGFGVMFCSVALMRMVMTVLDAKRITGADGQVLRATNKHTAFSKVESRVVLELPSNPRLSTRKLMTEDIKKRTTPNCISDPGLGHAHCASDVESLETRPTRTTGDLPREPTDSRPNDCDRPHRQKLRGNVRGSNVRGERGKAHHASENKTDRDYFTEPQWHGSWSTSESWWSRDTVASSSSQSQDYSSHSQPKSRGKGNHVKAAEWSWNSSGWWD